jgi:hypothetical protein
MGMPVATLVLHSRVWTETLCEMGLVGVDGDTSFEWRVKSKHVPRIGERIDLDHFDPANTDIIILDGSTSLTEIKQLINGCYRVVDVRCFVNIEAKLVNHFEILLERTLHTLLDSKIFGF